MLRLLWIVCLICCARLLPAQTALQPVAGLPTKEINDLHVDRKGYLWVAHSLGLSRYDGLSFIHFTHPGQITLRTTGIIEDRQGRIWSHNFSGQLYYVEKGQMKALEAYDYRQESQYPRIALLGNELLVTSQRGLFICNTTDLTSRYIYFNQPQQGGTVSLSIVKNGAVIYTGTDWYRYEWGGGLQPLKAGAEVMSDGGNTVSLQPQAFGDTLFLTANPSGILQKLLLRQGQLQVVGQQIFNDYINAVTIDGQAWIHTRNESATTDGALRIKARNLTDVVTGKEGNTWYSGLKGGLMVGQRAHHWKLLHFPIEGDDYVRSLNVGDDYFFAGTQKGNLLVMDQDSGKVTWRHNLFNGYGSIDFIRYYKNSRFLVGSSVNTYIINPREKKIEDLLPLDAILDVDFDGGNLYLATTQGFYLLPYIDSVLNLPGWLNKRPIMPGNIRLQKGSETFLFSPFRSRAVRYDKSAEALFVASKNGLQQVDEKGIKPFYIGGKEVFATSLWYKHPRLYIGTINDGLWVKEGDRLQHFTTANAIFSNTILRLKVTGHHLWLFQNNGLQVFDTETSQILQNIDLPVIEGDNVFDVAEKDNFAYLTTAEGIYKVPIQVAVSRPPPQGFLDYILVNNRDTIFGDNIDLPYHKNDVQFFFSSPAFSDPASITFKYRLLGANDDWQVTKPAERMLRYPALQPGAYQFEVLAVDRYGMVQQQPLVYTFHIAKPWWTSLWFLVAVNLLVVGMVFLFIRHRLNQKLKMEMMRRNISGDLHDDIGATLSSVNIYAALARSQKDKEPYLELIQQHVTDAVTRLDDLVWSINPRNDTMEGLVTRMKTTALPLLQAAGIQAHFYCDEKVLTGKLSLVQKRHLYLLFKEMLNNVVKHAGCTNCFIRLEMINGLLTLRIEDDGVGFDPGDTSPHRNGIQNMYARAEKLKGSIKIVSSQEKGSTLQVQLRQ